MNITKKQRVAVRRLLKCEVPKQLDGINWDAVLMDLKHWKRKSKKRNG